jgi:PEGA domain-containing protein
MKKLYLFFLLVFVSLVISCSGSTMIKSIPSGAKLYVDGQYAGETPYHYSDQKIVTSETKLKLKLDGYRDFNIIMQRNEKFDPAACAGGCIVTVPFLWIMKYNPERTYELEKENK